MVFGRPRTRTVGVGEGGLAAGIVAQLLRNYHNCSYETWRQLSPVGRDRRHDIDTRAIYLDIQVS